MKEAVVCLFNPALLAGFVTATCACESKQRVLDCEGFSTNQVDTSCQRNQRQPIVEAESPKIFFRMWADG